jgi:hypothetical protein
VTDPDFYEDDEPIEKIREIVEREPNCVTARRCNGGLLCKYPDSPWLDTEHRCERPLGHDDVCSDGTVTWTSR